MKFFILTSLLLLAPSVFAAEPLTLNAAVQQALTNNPQLKAWDAELTGLRAGAKAQVQLEDPHANVMFRDVPTNRFDVRDGSAIEYSLEQTFPFPGKRHTEGKMLTQNVAVRSSEIEGMKLALAAEVKMSFAELYRIEQSEKVLHELKGMLDAMIAGSKTRYATNQLALDELMNLQIERDMAEGELDQLSAEDEAHRAHLQAMLQENSDDDLLLSNTLPLPKLHASHAQLEEIAKSNRPELQSARASEASERFAVHSAREAWLPDVGVELGYSQMPNQQDAWFAKTQLSLPFANLSRRHYELKAAKANEQAAKYRYESLSQHTTHDLHALLAQFEANEKLITLAKTRLVPQARLQFLSLKERYALGKAPTQDVVFAFRNYKEQALNRYELEAQLVQTASELEQLLGKPLEAL